MRSLGRLEANWCQPFPAGRQRGRLILNVAAAADLDLLSLADQRALAERLKVVSSALVAFHGGIVTGGTLRELRDLRLPKPTPADLAGRPPPASKRAKQTFCDDDEKPLFETNARVAGLTEDKEGAGMVRQAMAPAASMVDIKDEEEAENSASHLFVH
ncbi:hypothetical protein LTR08_004822 [Meristemomyces frigidus]|nr:hypothetical protein LTR08_004822 [Meristemomyces frigidus]